MKKLKLIAAIALVALSSTACAHENDSVGWLAKCPTAHDIALQHVGHVKFTCHDAHYQCDWGNGGGRATKFYLEGDLGASLIDSDISNIHVSNVNGIEQCNYTYKKIGTFILSFRPDGQYDASTHTTDSFYFYPNGKGSFNIISFDIIAQHY